jgi:hypothetical protein
MDLKGPLDIGTSSDYMAVGSVTFAVSVSASKHHDTSPITGMWHSKAYSYCTWSHRQETDDQRTRLNILKCVFKQYVHILCHRHALAVRAARNVLTCLCLSLPINVNKLPSAWHRFLTENWWNERQKIIYYFKTTKCYVIWGIKFTVIM